MTSAMIELATSLAGIIELVSVILLLVFALDKNYKLSKSVSENITKLSNPATDQLLRTIFAVVGFVAGLYIILSRQYGDDVEKWAMGLLGTIVGSYISSTSKGVSQYR